MAQETVAELAKEFRMTVGEAVEVLNGLGVEVDSGTSPVEEADAEIFRELISEERRQNLQLQRKIKRERTGDLLTGDVRADERTAEEIAADRLAADTSAIEIDELVPLRQLAELCKIDPGELMFTLQAAGKPATINTRFPAAEAIDLAAQYSVRLRPRASLRVAETKSGKQRTAGTVPAPPVVTIMGHVDHGKTTLLDCIRHANVVDSEAGGITQHIGAYQVEHRGKLITFIDTPGHEAFTAMRARGAQVTDIVILVVAADDGVMPQTVEAINHAKAAEVPIIVAINKMDMQGADPSRVKQQLLEYSLICEEFGGDVMTVECSALRGEGVDEVLEAVLLTAEFHELTANPRLVPSGTVIEAQVDKGRGPVATILVRDGTLKQGDALVIGRSYGRVRSLLDFTGKSIKSAGPSTPVQVVGLNEVPEVGDPFAVAKDERRARKLADERLVEIAEEVDSEAAAGASLEELFAAVQAGAVDSFNVVVKGDVQGSVEAICHKLEQLTSPDVRVTVKHSGVGPITKTDIDLAKTTGGVIIGFNVSVEPQVRKLADDERVEIRLYAVIYHLLDDVRQALEGMLAPEYVERIVGHAEVLQLFKISNVGTIAGCRVTNGRMRRGANVRVLRGGQHVFDGKLESLRRVKESVAEVGEGLECGMYLSNYSGYAVGDVLECYTVDEIARTLDV